jgi:hypothetical protein
LLPTTIKKFSEQVKHNRQTFLKKVEVCGNGHRRVLGFKTTRETARSSEWQMFPAASERVRQRIKEWVDQHGYGSQRQLARSVPAKFGEPHGDQWISDLVKGKADLRLKDLDPIADAMGVPPGWLVRRPDRNYEELSMQESKLLRYFRSLPETVRHGFITWMDYFFRAQDDTVHVTIKTRDAKTKVARQHEAQASRRRPQKVGA